MLELQIASIIINFFNSKNNFKTTEMWIEWRETVLLIYEDKYQSGEIHSNVNSGKVLSKKIKSASDILLHLNNETDKEELLSLLDLYKKIIESNPSYIPDSMNLELWIEIENTIGYLNKKLELKSNEWIKKKTENNFKTIIHVPASLKIILLDFFLRILSVWIYNNVFTSSKFDKTAFYAMAQFVFIPIIVVVYAIFRDKRIAKNTNVILSKIGKSNIVLKTKNNAWNYLLIVILSIIGSFVPDQTRRC
jgi:hypothetical protein